MIKMSRRQSRSSKTVVIDSADPLHKAMDKLRARPDFVEKLTAFIERTNLRGQIRQKMHRAMWWGS